MLGIAHTIDPSGVTEARGPGEAPPAYARRLARAKAEDVAARTPLTAFVLGADTIVVVDDAVLEKPRDDEDAQAMIALLAGRAHDVITAMCVVRTDTMASEEEAIATRVIFRRLTAAEIAGYVRSGEGRDKAGAYAVQGLGAGLVSRIEGSYGNVVGLPAVEVLALLRCAGALLEWP